MKKEELFAQSEVKTIMRSKIKPSDYNPRTISEEERNNLKRSLKKYGVVGGIVINEQTGNTIVGGHQKIAVLDDIFKFKEGNDYEIRAEFVNIDEKTEKELNITLNNPNVGGQWDYDKLAAIIPDIDYKNAGLTEADLSMIGVDYNFKSPIEDNISSEIFDLQEPVRQQREEEKAAKEELRQAEREAKIQHMKDVKQQAREAADQKADDGDAYVMLSFDNYAAKSVFMQRFGYDPVQKFIKGEDFDERCEVIMP